MTQFFYARGFVANNDLDAILPGGAILNSIYGWDVFHRPPGKAPPELDYVPLLEPAEEWALMRSGQENMPPYVVTITVTEANFSIVKGNIAHIHIRLSRNRDGERVFDRLLNPPTWRGPESFADLKHVRSTIDMNELDPRDLVDLHATVGKSLGGSKFYYLPYRELYSELTGENIEGKIGGIFRGKERD